jgi:protein SCO1/2
MTSSQAESAITILFSVVLLGAVSVGVFASDEMHNMGDMHMGMDMSGADPRAHHHHAMSQKVSVTTADYGVPQITLVREDNKSVSLPDEMNDGRPVILNFIYTTCTAVCPITSRTFAQLQDKLGEERNKVHMISITIDPEQDTAARLADYARKFGAEPQWHFYTGTSEASLAAQRAFDVYRGDKMNHAPVTLLRAAPGKSWLRIDGFASADDLLREYRKLVASP